MTTSAEQLTHSSLRLQLDDRGNRKPEAWRELVGQKRVNARFELLPNKPVRMSALGISVILQASLAFFVIAIPLFFPQHLIPKAIYIVTDLAGPPLEAPPPVLVKPVIPKVTPPPAVEKQPVPPPPQTARLIEPRIEAPKVQTRQIKEAELPKVAENLQPANVELSENKQPVRPRDPVKTGLLNTGSSAPATINNPLNQVQTGGFGDPNGLQGPSDPNKRAVIAAFGSPALPPGPGYGNGTGGSNGARGTIASTGFGNGVAIPPVGNTHHAGAVQSAGFADENQQVIEAPKKKAGDEAAAVEPVVILAKPKPVYTAEAIKLNLEGEVLLDVVFPASGGAVQVNRVVKGLGHGLDESAIRAAQQIQYKPAMSNGHAVDFPAVVHIVFQIAY